MLFTLKSKPAFIESDSDTPFMLISMPQYSFLTEKPVDEIALKDVLVWVDNPKENKELIDEIAEDLRQNLPDLNNVRVSYVDEESNENVLKIIDTIFYVTIGIMMFLCFFSLVASMSANLYDQSKEIGVMRSIGITSIKIKLLYFYEALILVLSSCLLGVFIGMTVGYTMALQQNMFMGSSITPFFPWKQTLQITVLSLFCAFFSTYGPATQITRK